MQGFDENSVLKIKFYGRKGKMETEAAHKGHSYIRPMVIKIKRNLSPLFYKALVSGAAQREEERNSPS